MQHSDKHNRVSTQSTWAALCCCWRKKAPRAQDPNEVNELMGVTASAQTSPNSSDENLRVSIDGAGTVTALDESSSGSVVVRQDHPDDEKHAKNMVAKVCVSPEGEPVLSPVPGKKIPKKASISDPKIFTPPPSEKLVGRYEVIKEHPSSPRPAMPVFSFSN